MRPINIHYPCDDPQCHVKDHCARCAQTWPCDASRLQRQDLGVAWDEAVRAIPEGYGLSVAADGPGYVARATGPGDLNFEAWSQSFPDLPSYDPEASPALALRKLVARMAEPPMVLADQEKCGESFTDLLRTIPTTCDLPAGHGGRHDNGLPF